MQPDTKKTNPTPALPLPGEGVKVQIYFAPPPAKGEAGRGFKHQNEKHHAKH